MSGSRTHRRAAFGAAPLVALLALAPAATAVASASAPAVCHLLSQPKDAYHLGCREGFSLGVSAGYENGLVCRKLPPPLSPVNPTPYEQGKRQGYVDGYNQAYAHTYERHCDQPQLPPAQQQPPPTTQTPSSMAAAGQAAGTTWGKEDARLTCTREHANLVPPKTPDTLITAYQNGYRVGYDTAYDEAYRQLCMNK